MTNPAKLLERADCKPCQGIGRLIIGLTKAGMPKFGKCRDCDGSGKEPLCSDCPPIGYPTNKTRCNECPAAAALAGEENEN